MATRAAGCLRAHVFHDHERISPRPGMGPHDHVPALPRTRPGVSLLLGGSRGDSADFRETHRPMEKLSVFSARFLALDYLLFRQPALDSQFTWGNDLLLV